MIAALASIREVIPRSWSRSYIIRLRSIAALVHHSSDILATRSTRIEATLLAIRILFTMIAALTSIREVVPRSWGRSEIRDACIVAESAVDFVTSSALNNPSLPAIRILVTVSPASVPTIMLKKVKWFRLLIIYLFHNSNNLFFIRIGLRGITQLIHLSTNILSTLAARIESTHLTVRVLFARFPTLTSSRKIVPIFICILTIGLAIVVSTCILLVSTLAVLLALF
jgi:hypothetical protein